MTSGRADPERRILWITERYPPTPGGMATSCARQVRGLRRRELAVDVVALGRPAAELEVQVLSRERGVDLLVSRAVSRGYLAQKVWQMVRDRHAVRPYTALVGFGASFSGYLAVTYAAWLGLDALVLVRGNDLDRDWFDARRAPLVRESLARARVVAAVSSDKAEQVRGLFPQTEVRWLANGIDVERWDLLPADQERRDELRARLAVDGRRVVGIFGELKPKKRIPFWLSALRDRALMERLGFLVVGRADEPTDAVLADATLTPHVHRVPFVESDALAGLYAACDYLALPSMFEGMPNVLLEAMACRVVPVCAATGGMADVVEDGVTGFLFPPEDRAAAGETMERALALSDEELATVGKRAREQVRERFSVEREIEDLEEILDTLHEGKGATK